MIVALWEPDRHAPRIASSSSGEDRQPFCIVAADVEATPMESLAKGHGPWKPSLSYAVRR